MAAPPDLTRRGALAASGVLVLVVAGSWAPSLVAPLGDNHEGRVDARFALQVDNLSAEGLTGSGWISSMEPYAGRYANHPPGPNVAQAAIAAVAGHGATQVRLFPYLAGLLTLPAAAWLLRALGCSRAATVAAVALLAGTPLFWCFGRLLWDVPLLFAAPAAILTVRSRRPRNLAAAALLVLATVLMSWIGAATAAAFVLVRSIADRGERDRPALAALAGAGVLGAGLAGAWFLAATSTTRMTDQLEFRTSGGSFTTGEFVARQVDGLLTLVPMWSLLLALLGSWVAWRARGRARLVLAVSTALGVLFVVALPNGSYIHDYWIYPLLVPVTIATGLAADTVLDRTGARVTAERLAVGATAVGMVLVVAMAVGGVGQTYFRDPEAAGRLAARTAPAAGQEVAWTANGVDTARWLSWYWDLPARPLDGAQLAEAPAGDLVLVAQPLPAPFTDVAVVDREGAYALVRLGDLRARCRTDAVACG